MAEASVDAFDALIRKLNRLADLSDDDRQAIATLPVRVSRLTKGTLLVQEGSLVSDCCLLIQGYAFRSKIGPDGDRQIMSFHVAGDIVDVQHLMLSRADHDVETLTDAVILRISHSDLTALIDNYPSIRKSLWRSSLIEASIFREWIFNVGQREAVARIAHLICEFAVLREAAGLGGCGEFDLPMHQHHIGEATGLTGVHVNRMLRLLTQNGILKQVGRSMRVLDWQRLQAVGEFEPDYLHLEA